MIVLAREDRRLCDLAVERQPRADRRLDRGPVAHRQRARQPQTDRAGVRIGRRALIVRAAAAEHLRLRQQLRVDFHAHDDVVFLFQLRRPLGESVCFTFLICKFRRGVANRVSFGQSFYSPVILPLASLLAPVRRYGFHLEMALPASTLQIFKGCKQVQDQHCRVSQQHRVDEFNRIASGVDA